MTFTHFSIAKRAMRRGTGSLELALGKRGAVADKAARQAPSAAESPRAVRSQPLAGEATNRTYHVRFVAALVRFATDVAI